MDCITFEKKIPDYLEQNLADLERRAFQEHNRACSKCAADLEAFETIASEASSFEKLHASETLWENIEAQLDAPPLPFLNKILRTPGELKEKFFRIPAPVFQLAAVSAVLIAGIFIGRHFSPTAQKDFAQQTQQQSDVRLIARRADSFVEKSKVLFLGIVNADVTHIKDSDWNSEKRMAQNLVKQAAVLKDELSSIRQERLKLLIEELELILLEISHIEEEYDAENIELIKSGIDQKGLLLKITLHDLSEEKLSSEKALQKQIL